MFVFFVELIKKELNMDHYKKDFPLEEEIEDDFCDLDKNKICDNCGKCIESNVNYKIIKITKIENDDKNRG